MSWTIETMHPRWWRASDSDGEEFGPYTNLYRIWALADISLADAFSRFATCRIVMTARMLERLDQRRWPTPY